MLARNDVFIPFTAEEFLYLNQWGEIALLSVGNLSERILMSNTTYVSIILLLFPSLSPTTTIIIHSAFDSYRWSLIVLYHAAAASVDEREKSFRLQR